MISRQTRRMHWTPGECYIRCRRRRHLVSSHNPVLISHTVGRESYCCGYRGRRRRGRSSSGRGGIIAPWLWYCGRPFPYMVGVLAVHCCLSGNLRRGKVVRHRGGIGRQGRFEVALGSLARAVAKMRGLCCVFDGGRVVSQRQVVGNTAGSCGGSGEVLSSSSIDGWEHRRLAVSWRQRRSPLHRESGDLRRIRV